MLLLSVDSAYDWGAYDDETNRAPEVQRGHYMRASYGEAAHPSSDWFGGEESQQVHPTAPNGAQNRGTGDWQLIKLYIEMRKGLFFYLETCYVN